MKNNIIIEVIRYKKN